MKHQKSLDAICKEFATSYLQNQHRRTNIFSTISVLESLIDKLEQENKQAEESMSWITGLLQPVVEMIAAELPGWHVDDYQQLYATDADLITVFFFKNPYLPGPLLLDPDNSINISFKPGERSEGNILFCRSRFGTKPSDFTFLVSIEQAITFLKSQISM